MDELMEKFNHEVKKWLQNADICRNCGTLMDRIAGGICGKYKPDGVNDSFLTSKCPKCGLQKKEVTKIEWAENGDFKTLTKEL